MNQLPVREFDDELLNNRFEPFTLAVLAFGASGDRQDAALFMAARSVGSKSQLMVVS